MSEYDRKARKRTYKPYVLIGLLVTGIILHQLNVIDWFRILNIAETYAHHWWFPPLIVTVKAVLYIFALPGSSMYWVAGLLYEPLPATLIIVIGGVGGAIGAYFFSRSMSDEMSERIESSRFFSFLKVHGDFASLSAARTLPNFPHSVINYGAGILNIPFPSFFFSTLIGFTAKGYLYTSAIHHAMIADELSDVVKLETLLPLILLTALFIIGKLLQKRLSRKTTGQSRDK
jgi:uncharacterized membrane protein YdjX (TVP38/TMEM64 family)